MGSYYAGISRYLAHSRPVGSKNGVSHTPGYKAGEPAKGILINGRYYYEDELKGSNNAVARAASQPVSRSVSDRSYQTNVIKALRDSKNGWVNPKDITLETLNGYKKEEEDKPVKKMDLSPAISSPKVVDDTKKKKKKKKSSSKKVKKTKSKKKEEKNDKVPVLKNVSNLTGAVSGKSEEFIKNLIAQQSKHR